MGKTIQFIQQSLDISDEDNRSPHGERELKWQDQRTRIPHQIAPRMGSVS